MKPSEKIERLNHFSIPPGSPRIFSEEMAVWNHYRINAIIDFLDERYEEKETHLSHNCTEKGCYQKKEPVSKRDDLDELINDFISYKLKKERNALIDELLEIIYCTAKKPGTAEPYLWMIEILKSKKK